MARYHGKTGVVYLSPSGSVAATATVSLSGWTIDQAADTVEVAALGDSNKQYVQGLRDLKGTLAGWWDDTNDNLFKAAEAADGTKLYLYPSSLVPTIYWYGPAWLNASLSAGVGGAVSVAANFVARGDWARKP